MERSARTHAAPELMRELGPQLYEERRIYGLETMAGRGDMELHLTDTERTLLTQLLQNYLGDLRMEIRDTDSFTYRQGLKADEHALGGILGRLRGVPLAEAVQTP